LSDASLHRRELLGLGAGFAATAVAPATLAQPRGRATFNWTLHRPEEVGMTRAGLEGVRSAIQKRIDAGEQTGAVSAIARHGKLVWYEAQGVRDVETGEPMRKDDIFRMMSSSKCVTAVAVLMMLDAGKLSLDDTVSRFIPSFAEPKVVMLPDGWKEAMKDPKRRAEVAAQAKLVPASREITIKDLLTHTSGLMSAGDGLDPGPGTLVNRFEIRPGDTLASYIPRLGNAALDFDPSSKWRYSALAGIDTLLYVVEVASGQPADAFLRERLFEPLDMRDTHFNVPRSKYGRVLTLYERKGKYWRPARGLFGYEPTTYFSGAGGLLSTVHDYMQFEEMLRNRGELNGRRILKPQSVALMSTNHVGSLFADWIPAFTGGSGFGLGVRVVHDPKVTGSGRSPGAFGWGGAYGTESWVDPALDLSVCYFVQQPVRPAMVDFEHAVRRAVVA
jgi:CubicO group peptidase (beta-lactamase class C family)